MAERTDNLIPLKSRAPMSRMMIIHELLQKEKLPNRRQLAEKLEISRKTIQRDIDFMRDRLGLPIEYDEKRYGYYYTEPVHHFPNMEITEGEVVALFMAQKALSLYKGTPFEKPLRAAFEKLAHGLQETISISLADLDSAFSFSMQGLDVTDAGIFEVLSRCVLGSREVEFEYCKLESSKYETRRVQPYHLSCVEKQWYLFAFDLNRQEVRTFAVSRIGEARMTPKTFAKPSDFSFPQHLANSFGVRTGAKLYEVRIWFDSLAAKLVRERVWHPSQKIEELEKGEVELKMTLNGLTEVKRWVLSWGQRAKVLAPDELIVRLEQDAAVLAENYLRK